MNIYSHASVHCKTVGIAPPWCIKYIETHLQDRSQALFQFSLLECMFQLYHFMHTNELYSGFRA